MKMTLRWIFIIKFCLLLNFSALAFPNVDEDEEDVYFILSGEADKAVDEGDYVTAISRIIEALEIEPNNPSNVLLLSNLGTMYSYLNQDSLALATFDKALSLAPSMTLVIEKRAKQNLKMGNTYEAYTDFTNVIARDSCNIMARYYHGLMSLYGGDQYTAEKDFEILRTMAPDDVNTAIALSSLYSLTGRDKDAIPYYNKLVEEDPQSEFFAALAGCYLSLDRLSDASETISKGLSLYPDDPELYYYRAWLNRESYRLKEAREDAAKAVRLGLDPKKAEQLFSNRP